MINCWAQLCTQTFTRITDCSIKTNVPETSKRLSHWIKVDTKWCLISFLQWYPGSFTTEQNIHYGLLLSLFISSCGLWYIALMNLFLLKDTVHDSGERLLIFELNSSPNYIPQITFCAPETRSWSANFFLGSVWAIMFVSHLQSQDSVQTPVFFERTASHLTDS